MQKTLNKVKISVFTLTLGIIDYRAEQAQPWRKLAAWALDLPLNHPGGFNIDSCGAEGEKMAAIAHTSAEIDRLLPGGVMGPARPAPTPRG